MITAQDNLNNKKKEKKMNANKKLFKEVKNV